MSLPLGDMIAAELSLIHLPPGSRVDQATAISSAKTHTARFLATVSLPIAAEV